MSVARPNPSHEHDSNLRPIVALLAFAVAEDIAVRLLNDLVIAPAPRPLHGLALVAYFVSTALVMAWPGALAWAAWRVFVPQKQNGPDRSEPFGFLFRRSRCGTLNVRPLAGPVKPLDIVAAVYAGAVVSLVALHPVGASRTQALLLAWEVAALGFAVVAIAKGWRRAAAGERWTVAHAVLLVLVPVEAAVCAIGPFARPDAFSAWHVARWQYLAAFAIVAGMLGIRRRAAERSRSAP